MTTLVETLAVKLVGDTDDYTKKMGAADKKLAAFASKMKSVGTKMSLGVTAPLVAMGAVAVKAASNLQESMSKVTVVFGEQADAIETWSDTSAEAFGLSQQEALEAAGTFGNLFDALDIGKDDAANMSTKLVELAGDLASFNNIDPTEALEKLRAGITGEAEPLKALGINMNAATIEAKALELGLIAIGEEMSEQDKVSARYALMLEQSGNAQGDFGRTSDGMANTLRTLRAQLTDMAADIGTILLPVAQDLLNWVKDVVTWFKDVPPGVQKWTVIGSLFLAAVGPLLWGIGMMVSAITGASGLVHAIAVAGAALLAWLGPIAWVAIAIALLVVAWNTNFLGLQDNARTGYANMVRDLTTFRETVEPIWQSLNDNITTGGATMWRDLLSSLKTSLDLMAAITTAGLALVTTYFQQYIDTIASLFNRFDWESVGGGVVQGIINGIMGGWDMLMEAARNLAQAARAVALQTLGIDIPTPPRRPFLLPQDPLPPAMGSPMNPYPSPPAGPFLPESPSPSSPGSSLSPFGYRDKAGESMGPINMSLNFYGPADAAQVRGASQDGVLAALRQVGLR